uniref:Repulsive guidance molecule n=1 Tax=Caenorhabditis japonica TaxID=281687 RepID=A0A8R1DL59_CAEJA
MSMVHLFALAAIAFSDAISACRVEECALWFHKTKEYENLEPKATERYCQALQTYLKCMNDTMRFCHGNLRFHSSELVMRRHWKEFECEKWESCNGGARSQVRPINTCYFNPPPSNRKIKYCALFGDPHLLMFNGSVQTCSEEGARPLVENRYFLVQVTNKNVRAEALTTTVAKITVLIRKHNCTSTLRYEANADEQGLPQGFTDGTTFQRTDHNRNSVEVLSQDNSYVEIAMHYIHSSIHIRRQGPYLSVSVKAPSSVLETDSDVSNEMCWSGCSRFSVIAQESVFRKPEKFVACYARQLHVPKKVAEERCSSVGTTDAFFAACVFDLMLTGDDYLVHLARNVQSDFRRLAPYHLQSQIIKNRFSTHNDNQNSTETISDAFQGCLSSNTVPSSNVFLAIILMISFVL